MNIMGQIVTITAAVCKVDSLILSSYCSCHSAILPYENCMADMRTALQKQGSGSLINGYGF